jgi:hypothetical protein
MLIDLYVYFGYIVAMVFLGCTVAPFTLSKVKVSDYKWSDCSTEENHGNNISKVDIQINQHSQQVVVPPANIADKNMKMISYSSDTNKYVEA